MIINSYKYTASHIKLNGGRFKKVEWEEDKQKYDTFSIRWREKESRLNLRVKVV